MKSGFTCAVSPCFPLRRAKPLGALALLAGLSLPPGPFSAEAQAPAYNPKAPLQFYEMARRQGFTDASCAVAAAQVERMLIQHGAAAPQLVPAWRLRLGDAL